MIEIRHEYPWPRPIRWVGASVTHIPFLAEEKDLKEAAAQKVTRAKLYDAFIERWFQRQKDKLDDQLKAYDLTFFDLTHKRLLQRIAESKDVYAKILDQPFDYNKEESFNSNYESHYFKKII